MSLALEIAVTFAAVCAAFVAMYAIGIWTEATARRCGARTVTAERLAMWWFVTAPIVLIVWAVQRYRRRRRVPRAIVVKRGR